MSLSQTDLNEIEKFALQNAVKYNAVPQVKAVMGKIMGMFPHLRKNSNEVSEAIREITERLSKETPEYWNQKLSQMAPELIDDLHTKKEPDKGLKALKNTEGKTVVMRFAPNPNGPPTLGSSRGMIVNSEYAKQYQGKFVLRFDDTDPDKKRPMLEAYDWYVDDFKWLSSMPDEIYRASDRLSLYYDVARDLIKKGGAYVCFCHGDTFKSLKDSKKPCPHRNANPEENMEHWERMIRGDYGEREAVLRIKTDIEHKDPALRDWGAFRILKKSHPRPEISDRFCVWPLLDFQGAVDDHLLKTTHIIRGKDLMDSGRRQKYIYDYMGWTYPTLLHWGRVRIEEFGKLSTSGIKAAIERGEYTGWDDPRLPTILAIRRRGIQPEALKKFMIEMGVGETDISISMESLYAENRKFVDPTAHRYFFVWDPVEIEIEGFGPSVAKAPLHPSNTDICREINVKSNIVLICKSDISGLNLGDVIRLKDLCNIKIVSLSPLKAQYIDNSLETLKREKPKIIHWVPSDGVSVKVMGPEGIVSGIGEPGIKSEIDNVVQFERFGFCRIDSVLGKEVVAYFAHK